MKNSYPGEWKVIHAYIKRLEKLLMKCDVPEALIEGKKLIKLAQLQVVHRH